MRAEGLPCSSAVIRVASAGSFSRSRLPMDPDYAARYGSIEQWHWWFRGRQRILEDVLRRELAGRAPADAAARSAAGPAQGFALAPAFRGRRRARDRARRRSPRTRGRDGRGGLRRRRRWQRAPLASGSVDAGARARRARARRRRRRGAARGRRACSGPAGCCSSTVPALPSLWGRRTTINQHRRRYTRATLGAAFARAGLPRRA